MKNQILEALNEIKENEDTEIFEDLIREYDFIEPEFARAAFEQRIFCPASLYKDADAKVRDGLIAILDNEEKEDDLDINGILVALAEIGDDEVVKAFKRWKENPPKWRQTLYVGPETYAMEGNWCIENGEKKSLVFDKCFAILKVEDSGNIDKNLYGGPSDERCPHCDSQYVNLLKLDGDSEQLKGFGIKGKLTVKTCMSCLPYGDYIFSKYDENGESKIVYHESGDGDEIDDEDQTLAEEHCFVLSEKPVAIRYCSKWEDSSAVGGVPQYIDDANYPACPECGKIMKHLAQLGEEYTQYGNIYVRICQDCKITATNYQQS